MSLARKQRIEFGDFQTPDTLALQVCQRLRGMGIQPDVVIEPTCGVGAFVVAAAQTFPEASIKGFEVNGDYLDMLYSRLPVVSDARRIELTQADFFTTHWRQIVSQTQGSLLIIGNFCSAFCLDSFAKAANCPLG